MSFLESIKSCFIKYSDFKTRSSRSEFWWFALFQVIVNLVTSPILGTSFYLLAIIISFIIILPSLAVGARRLHDTNRSGWWQLLQLPTIYIFMQPGISNFDIIAIFLPVIPLIIWWIQTGTTTENKYGTPINQVSNKTICPKCQFELESTTKFCGECGSQIFNSNEE